MTATSQPSGAIVGLGLTEMTRRYTGGAVTLAARAVRLALEDAGLEKTDLDGLLINSGISGMRGFGPGNLSLNLQSAMGLKDLRLANHMNAAGSTAGQMVQYDSLAIQ